MELSLCCPRRYYGASELEALCAMDRKCRELILEVEKMIYAVGKLQYHLPIE